MSQVTIRRATAADAATIARHRVCMFREMGQITSESIANELLAASTEALALCLANGSYVGWLAVDRSDNAMAGGGVHVKPQLPRPLRDCSGIEVAPLPLVVNVYTEPEWRKRGLARSLMNTILEWAAAHGSKRVVLHASDDGRRLYESMGFVATNEMEWTPCGDAKK